MCGSTDSKFWPHIIVAKWLILYLGGVRSAELGQCGSGCGRSTLLLLEQRGRWRAGEDCKGSSLEGLPVTFLWRNFSELWLVSFFRGVPIFIFILHVASQLPVKIPLQLPQILQPGRVTCASSMGPWLLWHTSFGSCTEDPSGFWGRFHWSLLWALNPPAHFQHAHRHFALYYTWTW